MKKIQYHDLQEKYAGKLVAMDQKETKVLAIGKRIEEILKKLQSKKLDKTDFVISGPIQKVGSINVYFSLPNKKNRRRINCQS